MIYSPYLPLILVLYQFSMLAKCDYINVTFSATNITLNGSFNITLLGFEPNPGSYPSMRCFSSFQSGSMYTLLRYNYPRQALGPEAFMAAVYTGRVNIINDRKAAISPVKFTDEKMIFKCTLIHHDKITGDPIRLISDTAMIENVYAYPVFTSNLPSVETAIEGIPKPISCKVKSRPASTVTWLHDEGVIGNKTQGVTRDGYYFITIGTFTINDPLYSMTGKKITCTGKSIFGSPIKQNTTLDIVYRPKNTTFSVLPSKIVLNTNIQLNCSAVGIPGVRNYRFYVNDILVGNTTDGKLIVKVSPSNCANFTGEYKCIPESTIGDGEMKTAVREFELSASLSSSQTILEYYNVTIYCSSKDCPTSAITWKKDRSRLAGRAGEKLQLLSVTGNDTGEYSCHASFRKTTNTSRVTVIVSYGPKNTIFSVTPANIVLNTNIQLDCSAVGIPSVRNYRFYLNDILIGNTTDGKLTLKVSRSNCANFTGEYKCIPENTIGDGEMKTAVREYQLYATLNSPQAVYEGQDVTIYCSAKDCPTSNIKWKKNGISLEGTTGNELQLLSVTRNDTGEYSCHANVRKATNVAKITVVVERRIKVSSNAWMTSGVTGGQLAVVVICILVYGS